MYDYEVRLDKIKGDRQSGSLQILNNTINVIQEALSERDLNISDLKTKVVDVSSVFPDFAVLNHFISGINKVGNTKEEFLDFISAYELEWNDVDRDISIHFLSSIEVNNSTILLHSNSRTIHALFEEIAMQKYNVEVYQTESHPGREGVLQAEYLRKLGFNVFLINDDEVIDLMNPIEMFLIGADGIEPENIINKTGSSVIAKMFVERGKPVFVLADSRKIIKDERPVKSLLFEKVPGSLVTGVITEKGLLN